MNGTTSQRLSTADYNVLGEFIAQTLREQIVPTPGVITSSHQIKLVWRRPGLKSLHLIINLMGDGIHASLYEGDGAHHHGEGVRHGWNFFQDLFRDGCLGCSGIAMSGERDNPFGTDVRYQLRFDHPLVTTLPGYNPTAASLLVAMADTVTMHLSRLGYVK